MGDSVPRQGVYERLEDSWYSFLESLEGRGVPVHVVVEPLEMRGVPSLPAFLALIVLLAAASAFLFFGAQETIGLSVKVLSGNEPVEGATVRVWSGNQLVAEDLTGGEGFLEFGLQGDFVVEVVKQGYSSRNSSVSGGEALVLLEKKKASIMIPLKNPDVEFVSENEWRAAGGANSESSTGKVIVYVAGSDGSKPDASISVYYANGVLAAEGKGNAFIASLAVDSQVFVMAEADGYLAFDGSKNKELLTPAGVEFSVVLKKLDAAKELVSGACSNGEQIDCTTADNCVGVQTCKGAEFSDCLKAEPASCAGPCFEGNTIECRTKDNCVGSMTCKAEGYYGECVKASPPKCFSPADKEAYSMTVVRAVDEEGRELSASINVFVEGGEAPLLRNKASGDELALDSTLEYYAVALKPGYYPEFAAFSAGGIIEILLRSADDPVSLRALVVDEFDGSDVNGALVSLFYVDAGRPRLIAGPEVARGGLAVFQGLEKGRIVSVRAAHEGRMGESGTLLAEENELQIVLELNQAELFVSAIDLETGNAVEAAFAARQNNETIDSCVGKTCSLQVKARQPFELETIARGYLAALNELTLAAGENDFTVKLLSEASAGDVSATLRGVKAWNGLEVNSLKLGHYYEAHFQLATDEVDYSGFFLRAGEGLTIVNYSPPAAVEELDGESIHLTYGGPVNRLVKIGFVVDDDLELDEATRSAEAFLEWRAFADRGGLQLRYPAFVGECAEPCEAAPTKNRTYLVYSPTTSCENNYCVSITLRQGSRESGLGAFNVFSMAGFAEGDPEFQPLIADWKVEFFAEAGNENALWLVAPQDYLEALEATYPIGELVGDYRLCGGGDLHEVSGHEVGVDLTGVQECSDYRVFGDYYSEPYSIGGTALFNPLEPSPTELDLAAEFYGAAASTHYSPFRITDQGFAATDYGIVMVSLQQEDLNGTPVKQNSTTHYEAYEVFNCFREDGSFNDNCPHSLLAGEMEFVAKRNRDENHVSVSMDGQTIKAIVADCGDYAVHAGDTGFSFDAGALKEGDSVRCKVLMAPLREGFASVNAELSVVDKDGRHDTEVNQKVFVNSLDGGREPDLSQPGFGKDCGLRPKIYFDSTLSSDRLHTDDGCDSISLKYSSVFPADAVTIEGIGERPFISFRVAEGGEELANCFESCDEYGSNCVPGFDALANEGVQVIKFNAFAQGCPAEFQPYGSSAGMAEGALKVELWVPGECNPDDEGCGTELIIQVSPYDADSLFIGPMFTTFEVSGEGEQVFYPQLWSVVNHRQFGERELLFVEDSAEGAGLTPYFRMTFNGPGQQVFAYHPDPGKKLSVYEISHPDKPRLITFLAGEEAAERTDPYGRDYPVYADPAMEDGVAVVQGLTEYALLSGGEDYCIEIGGERECTGQGFDNEIMYTNVPFDPDRAKALIKKARFTADQTSFWRSGTGELWCLNDCVNNGEVDVNCLADWEKCKPSLEDWRLYENVEYYDYHPCTFCNNSYHPGYACGDEDWPSDYLPCTYNEIDVFNCDQRCDATTQTKVVDYGEGECNTAYLKKSSIPKPDAQQCYEAEACPLLFDGEAPTCFEDDGDGFIQSNEYSSIEAATLVAGASEEPSYYCPSGKVLTVQPKCRAFCNDPCFNEYDCELFCNDEGLIPEQTGFERIQSGWLDGVKGACRESEADEGDYTDELPCLKKGFFNGEGTLQPAASFPEYDAETFSFHFPFNTINKEETSEAGEYAYWHDSLYGNPCNEEDCLEDEALRINYVEGCSLQDDVVYEAWNEQALYDVEVLNEPDVFTGQALWSGTARSLKLPSENYVGVQCRKPKDVWGETELCGPIWNDYSETYGACINSLYQFEEPDEGKPLWEANFQGRSLTTLTEKNSFIIPKTGEIIRFLDKGRIPYELLELKENGYWLKHDYWKPDGRYTASYEMRWETTFWESGWFSAIVAGAVIALTAGTGGFAGFFGTEIATALGFTVQLADVLIVAGAGAANYGVGTWIVNTFGETSCTCEDGQDRTIDEAGITIRGCHIGFELCQSEDNDKAGST